MWIIGIILSYFFYRFTFAWYFNIYFYDNPLQRPGAWRRPFFHIIVILVSISLLAAATFCFYLTASWMIVCALVLPLVSFIVYGIRRGSREEEMICKAVSIQVRMQKRGVKQDIINREIAIKTIGDYDPVITDFDFKDFLKFGVLSRVGLLNTTDPDISTAQINEIDSLVDKRMRIEEKRRR